MKLIVSLVGFVIASSSAWASCGSRPETPHNVHLSPQWQDGRYKLLLTWETKPGETLYWDISVRDKSGNIVIKQPPGTGPTSEQGSLSKWFDNAKMGRHYCIAIKGRDEPGSQGCVSLVASDPVCVKVPSAPPAR